MSTRLAVLVLVGLAWLGCGHEEPPPRPQLEAWLEGWQRAVAQLPTIEGFRNAATARALCDDTLGALRTLNETLGLAPDPSLDGPVTDWLDKAKALVFDCVIESGETAAFTERRAELDVIEHEIDAACAAIRRRG